MPRHPLAWLLLVAIILALPSWTHAQRQDPQPERRNRTPKVPFVPTPQDVVEKMLRLAEVKKADVVADLGCGDGRIVVTAARQYGCRAIGYDLDRECVRLSREKAKQAGVADLVRIEHADLFEADLSRVDVVTLYLGPTLN